MIEVGYTHQSMWNQIEEGITKDFPGTTFEVVKPSAMFPELSRGVVRVPESIAEEFLALKKRMTNEDGGDWVIDDQQP